jgi:hypothetical protein
MSAGIWLQLREARRAVCTAFIGFDEIHGYRNYDLFEALAPDMA